jgi:hypothetical protein
MRRHNCDHWCKKDKVHEAEREEERAGFSSSLFQASNSVTVAKKIDKSTFFISILGGGSL